MMTVERIATPRTGFDLQATPLAVQFSCDDRIAGDAIFAGLAFF